MMLYRLTMFIAWLVGICGNCDCSGRCAAVGDVADDEQDRDRILVRRILVECCRAMAVKHAKLTTGGHETNPVFSPDGRWIAFTGEYDGNATFT